MLQAGCRLTETSLELARRLGIATRVLPATDDPIRTWFETDQGTLPFQEFYVLNRAQPMVCGVSYAGIELARPSPEVVEALTAADLVVIGPSNPVVSVWPVLQVLAGNLSGKRTVAICPTVGGRALKGPTVEMMRSLGRDPSPEGVAREYLEVAGGFVLDQQDAASATAIQSLGYRVVVTDTLMVDPAAAERLARDVLAGF
jgi:LPPG:FO 2-phospho-L-lactate transferase